MSHFVVMVVGSNVERLLAPFHEFESTGLDDEYIQTIDTTADYADADLEGYENLRQYLEDYEDLSGVPFGESPDLDGNHKYGYFRLTEDGAVDRVFKRTNPNAQWDWYAEGGRWSGALLLKSGEVADAAFKRDIDIEKMRQNSAAEAELHFDLSLAKMGTLEFESLKQVLAKEGLSHDEKREFYNNQAPVVAFYEGVEGIARVFGPTPDDLLIGREQYIKNAYNLGLSAYALLSKESGWVERGQMGWFGVSNNEVSDEVWAEKLTNFIDNLGDDEVITMVDCHI